MIQVYTGNGKGKTTAALGLALRAAGAGFNVYICQFLKGKSCCELLSLKKLKNIKIEQFGHRIFIKDKPSENDLKLAKAGLEKIRLAIAKKNYQMIILDEANVALKLGLVTLGELVSVIESAPRELELVITGRGAHPRIAKLADLVSNIQEVKHYYAKGVKARRGIEF